MNQSSSHPNHENQTINEETPPQGLSEARRAGCFLIFCHQSAEQEAPSWAAAFIVPDGEKGNKPRTISEYYDFHRKSQKQIFVTLFWASAFACATAAVASAVMGN